jgi:small-conductance mechanosensitive channel
MNSVFAPQFRLFGHDISIAGIAGFAAAIIVGTLLSVFLQSDELRKLLSRLGLDKKFVALVTGVAGLMVFITSIGIGLSIAGLPVPWNEPMPGVGLSVSHLIRAVALLVVVFWLSSSTKRFLFNRYLSRIGMERSLQYAVAQMCSYTVLAVGLLVVLQNAGIDLSALTVFAGAVGVGLGFGLQNIARNFVSGLVILAERPITIGDRVEVDHVAGRVIEIRARSTIVITNDNIAIIVPNSQFIEKPVTNWTFNEPKVRFRIPVGVAFDSDVDKVRALLIEVAHEHPAALREPAPTVFFDSFGDYTLNFQLVVWSDEMSYRPRRFRSDLNFAIERKFRAAGVVIPSPQRDVRITTGLETLQPNEEE